MLSTIEIMTVKYARNNAPYFTQMKHWILLNRGPIKLKYLGAHSCVHQQAKKHVEKIETLYDSRM